MTKLFSYVSYLIVLTLAISLAGCKTVSAPDSPFEQWEPPVTIDTSDDVWLSIREQKIDTSEPLSLTDVISIAIQNNPSTRQAWFNARSAEAGVKLAQSTYFPQITLSGKAAYTNNELTKLLQTTDGYRTVETITYLPSLQLSLLVFDFGARNSLFTEAAETLMAANFQFNQSLLDLLLSVESAFYQLQSAIATLGAAEADLETANTTYEASQKRLDSGLGTKLDVLQARANLDKSNYVLEESKGSVKMAQAQLSIVLGLPADTTYSVRELLPKSPEIATHDISLLINIALEQRPDIAALRANLRAKKALLNAARSAFWPSIVVGASADGTWYQYREPDLDNDHESEYIGYVGVSWDIFDGFSNINKKKQVKEAVSFAKAQLIEAEIGASADVWTKYYSYETAVKKLSFSKAYFSSAKEAYDLAIESYNSGLQNIIDVLEAQSNLSSARSDLVGSQTDVLVSVAELAHATGSLFKDKVITSVEDDS